MNSKQKISKGPSRNVRIFFGLVALALFAFIFFSDHGILKRFTLENQKSELYSRIKQEEHNKDSLNRLIKNLYRDTIEIERIAREKYGMLKPGEEVFFINKKAKDN